MEINEGYFEISVQANLEHGRVNVSPGFAFPGTLITVTAEAHNGYKLKEGSLIYDGNGRHNVDITERESGYTYTFEMPAADVRVYAEFNKELGFTIEGPRNRMIDVTAEYSEGYTPPAISWTGHEWVKFTVDSTAYSAEAGNLKWLVNGEDVTELTVREPPTGNSLTIYAQDYIARTYTLTVMIKADDGLWYSGNYNFTVEE
jgi:hypothetical protein